MPPVLDQIALWTLAQGRIFMWILVATRVTGLMTALPAGQERVPMAFRVMLTLFMATLITPLVPVPPRVPETAYGLAAYLLMEFATGLLLGLVLMWILETVAFAAQLMDTQMGFSFVQLLDPGSTKSASISGTLLGQLAVILMLVSGLQNQMLLALVDSYRIVPVGSGMPGNPGQVILLMGMILTKGLQLAFPVLLVLFFVDVLEGISARFMPQLQLMQLSFPIKIMVGILTVSVFLNHFAPWLAPLMEDAPRQALKLLGILYGP